MKFNFSKPLMNLAGEPVTDQNKKPLTLGALLGSALVNQPAGDALAYHAWAIEMYNGRDVNLSRSDVKKIIAFLEAEQGLTVLSKAQILEVLDRKPEAGEEE